MPCHRHRAATCNHPTCLVIATNRVLLSPNILQHVAMSVICMLVGLKSPGPRLVLCHRSLMLCIVRCAMPKSMVRCMCHSTVAALRPGFRKRAVAAQIVNVACQA